MFLKSSELFSGEHLSNLSTTVEDSTTFNSTNEATLDTTALDTTLQSTGELTESSTSDLIQYSTPEQNLTLITKPSKK